MLLKELAGYYRTLSIKTDANLAYQRNCLKEYLHDYILSFIYKSPRYNKLVFYGGTCLRQCFNLPRLSEDLDFEDLSAEMSITELSRDLITYFKSEHSFDLLTTKVQKFRIYLKFPVLQALKITDSSESDFLNIKIEINPVQRTVASYSTEIQPMFKLHTTYFIKRYDLPTLMASKINAVLARSFIKKHKLKDSGRNGKITVQGKGRDYFDLLWYMQKQVVPNLSFANLEDQTQLWLQISERVKGISEVSLKHDLIDFLDSPREAEIFAANFKQSFGYLLKQYLK